MANERPQQIDTPSFTPTPELSSSLPSLPQDPGALGAAAEKTGDNLSDVFGHIADKLTVDEATKAGNQAGMDPNWRPTDIPTLRGRTFDAAAQNTYVNNMQIQMRQGVSDIVRDFNAQPVDQRLPSTLQGNLNAFRDQFQKDHVFPDIVPEFTRLFAHETFPVLKDASDNYAGHVRDQDQASTYANQVSASTSMSRNLALASPDGDAGARGDVANILGLIEQSRQKGYISSVQAEQASEGIRQQSLQQTQQGRADKLPLPQKAAFLQNFSTSFGTGGDYLTALGLKENASGDPNAGNGGGQYQFTAPTWQTLMRTHPELNLTPDGRTDPAQSKRAVAAFTADNQAALQAAGIPATPANTYMAHFLGAAGATGFIKAMAADPNRPATDVVGHDAASSNPKVFYKNGDPNQPRSLAELYALQTRTFGDPTAGMTKETFDNTRNWLVQNLAVANRAAEAQVNAAKTEIDGAISQETSAMPISDAARQALITKNANATDPKIQDGLATLNTVHTVIGAMRGQSLAKVVSIKDQLHDGLAGGVTAQQAEVLKHVDEYVKRYQEDVEHDPNGRAMREGVIPAQQPLDPTAPNLPAQILARTQATNAVGGFFQQPPRFFLHDEGGSFARAFGGVEPGKLAASSSPEVLAGMAQDQSFRDGLTGMARSGDAAKMSAAFSTLDTLQGQNPMEFKAKFGDGVNSDLSAWRSGAPRMPADQLAQLIMARNDPKTAPLRKQLGEQADADLKSLSTNDVVGMFSQRGWNPLTWGNPAAQPPTGDAPGQAPLQLRNDYVEAYKQSFETFGDKDLAKDFALKSISQKWGASPINGNRVMPFPPERWYPQVNGSFDWMKGQVDDAIKARVGDMGSEEPVAFGALGEGGAAITAPTPRRAAQQRAYNIAGGAHALVADATTGSEIGRHILPSYHLVVTDPQGRIQALLDPSGTPIRFRFDPSAAQAAARAEFIKADAAAKVPRPDMVLEGP